MGTSWSNRADRSSRSGRTGCSGRPVNTIVTGGTRCTGNSRQALRTGRANRARCTGRASRAGRAVNTIVTGRARRTRRTRRTLWTGRPDCADRASRTDSTGGTIESGGTRRASSPVNTIVTGRTGNTGRTGCPVESIGTRRTCGAVQPIRPGRAGRSGRANSTTWTGRARRTSRPSEARGTRSACRTLRARSSVRTGNAVGARSPGRARRSGNAASSRCAGSAGRAGRTRRAGRTLRARLAIQTNRTGRSEIALRTLRDEGERVERSRRRRRAGDDRCSRGLSCRVAQHHDRCAGDGDAALSSAVFDRPCLGDGGCVSALIQHGRDAYLRDIALRCNDRAESSRVRTRDRHDDAAVVLRDLGPGDVAKSRSFLRSGSLPGRVHDESLSRVLEREGQRRVGDRRGCGRPGLRDRALHTCGDEDRRNRGVGAERPHRAVGGADDSPTYRVDAHLERGALDGVRRRRGEHLVAPAIADAVRDDVPRLASHLTEDEVNVAPARNRAERFENDLRVGLEDYE